MSTAIVKQLIERSPALMKATFKLLNIITISFFTLSNYVIAQEDTVDLSTLDANGPIFNPSQTLIRKLSEEYKSCSLIDWAASGAQEVMHSFDRPEDNEKIYDLMEMSEELSMDWELKKKVTTSGGTTVIPWTSVTKQLKWMSSALVQRLKTNGYLREMLPFVMHDGKLRPVPNWKSIVLLPTSCGTLMFMEYKAQCRTEANLSYNENDNSTEFQLIRKDSSGISTQEAEKTLEPGYFLANFFPAATPISTIAQGLYMDRQVIYLKAWLTTLTTTQTVLELVPFVSSGVALAQLVDPTGYLNEGPLTVAQKSGMAADVLLDALPVIAQAKKLRTMSKQIYLYGSVAVLSLTVTKVGLQGNWKIDDMARAIVLSIVARNIKGMPKVARLDDLEKPLAQVGARNTNGLQRLVVQVSNTPGYLVEVADRMRKVMAKFTIPHDLPASDHLEALIKGFKLRNLPKSIRDAVVARWTSNVQKLDEYTKLVGVDDAAALRKIENLIDDLGAAGKGINPKTLEQIDFPLDKLNNAYESSYGKVLNLGLVEGSPEFRKKLEQVLEDSISEDVFPVINNLIGEASYRPGANGGKGLISYPEVNYPSYFYTQRFPYKKVIVPVRPGSVPPNTGPNGERIERIYWEDGGDNETKKAILDRVLLKIKGEEVTHAVDHIHEAKSGIVKMADGTAQEVSGTGFAHVLPNGNGLVSLGLVSSSIHTPNCIDWISRLTPAEIKQILSKYSDKFDNEVIDKVQAMDPFELDIFFRFWQNGTYLNSAFKNEYPCRLLAQEFIERNLPPIAPNRGVNNPPAPPPPAPPPQAPGRFDGITPTPAPVPAPKLEALSTKGKTTIKGSLVSSHNGQLTFSTTDLKLFNQKIDLKVSFEGIACPNTIATIVPNQSRPNVLRARVPALKRNTKLTFSFSQGSNVLGQVEIPYLNGSKRQNTKSFTARETKAFCAGLGRF